MREPRSTRDSDSPRTAVAWIAIAGVVAILVAGLGIGLIGPAVAGDAVAQFDVGQSEQSAQAGETVTVDVVLRSDGGYAGEGIESYGVVVAVPPAVGEPTSVEPGPWLGQGGGEVEQTVTGAGEGAIRIRHERVGAADGVTGADVAATVTIDLRADAPAADATVLVADPAAQLHGSDFAMRTFGDEATIVVGGGGERLAPAYEPGDRAGDDSVGVTTAEDANRTVSADDGSGGGRDSDAGGDSGADADPTPGFDLLVGAVGLLVVAFAAAARRR